jgi:molybdopterin-guanine dinucleotide biosynthesis protein A
VNSDQKMNVKNISGVILAGGANKRFNGITKANIMIDGKTIISRIVEKISDVFDEIIIVTNTPEEFSEFRNFTIVSDYFERAGPLGGIHAALKVSSKEALFVFAGDMPFLDKDLINRQVEYFNSNPCEVLVPSVNQLIEPLHAIYSVSIIESVEKYLAGDNDYAIHKFLKLSEVRYMQLEDSKETCNAFININSPADVSNAEKKLGIG